ncbi:MAG: hypothetical protein HUU47_09830 [Bacteroidetes bacterium]|nr:hypothetical protein [Bacteroidota bacterium]
MKKAITITVVFFTLTSISYKSFGQFDLDVTNNSASCTYNIVIEWDDGNGNCSTSSSILIPSSSFQTITNPLTSGTALYITITDNTCGNVFTIGDCSPWTCASCSLPCCYVYNCLGCGTPITFQFTTGIFPNNAQLLIQ